MLCRSLVVEAAFAPVRKSTARLLVDEAWEALKEERRDVLDAFELLDICKETRYLEAG